MKLFLWPIVGIILIGIGSIMQPAPAVTNSIDLIYDIKTLRYWKTRYPQHIQWNYNNNIWKNLTNAERSHLKSVQLEFPLYPSNGDPMSFWSVSNPKKVVLPIQSIKFLDDLCIASAWLETRGHGFLPLMDYMIALKYRRSELNTSKMSPLLALGLPLDPTVNSYVDKTSQNCLKSALLWILSHEVGHVYYNHKGYKNGLSLNAIRNNERQSDSFANEIFARIGLPPSGIAIFFSAASVWWTPPNVTASNSQWEEYLTNAYHPIESARLKSIAKALNANPKKFAMAEADLNVATLQVKTIANNIFLIADSLKGRNLKDQYVLRASEIKVKEMANGKYQPIAVYRR